MRLVRMGRALRKGVARALLLLALVCGPGAPALAAQATAAPASRPNELTVTAEPLGAGSSICGAPATSGWGSD